MLKVKDIISKLELLAPRSYQESYDNSGLIVGDSNAELRGVIVCLDSIESIVDEAIENDCNLIVAHHPIVFSGLKKITGSNYIERTIIKAIKNNIAIYAIHTNLDNMQMGVNNKIADKLGLINRRILIPKSKTLAKLSFYCPKDNYKQITDALHEAGAGSIGDYDYCNFSNIGEGSFRALDGANPHVGEVGSVHKEVEIKVEILVKSHLIDKIIGTLKDVHPYEEVAYFVHQLDNSNQYIGTGLFGELEDPIDATVFLEQLKSKMDTKLVRHTSIVHDRIKTIALVGGSGSFALQDAIRNNADIFITGDFKYHDFFDAEDKIIIADIGHYESEQFTIELLLDYIQKQYSELKVLATSVNTNPIIYL